MTLLELMMVLAVLAMMAVVAAPAVPTRASDVRTVLRDSVRVARANATATGLPSTRTFRTAEGVVLSVTAWPSGLVLIGHEKQSEIAHSGWTNAAP
ncbi:MAG: hypothetical protein KJZ74_06420 [Gemmatimonadales bacterium]|nr:hypothetical protein [Gemmatimonadales bacterium]